MEVEDFQWLHQAQAIKAVELSMSSLAYCWIHMNGINRLHIRMFFHHAPNGTEHLMHGLTKILSAMSCDEDHAAIARPGQIGVVVTVYDSCLQGIDTRIARDINPLGRLALGQKD